LPVEGDRHRRAQYKFVIKEECATELRRKRSGGGTDRSRDGGHDDTSRLTRFEHDPLGLLPLDTATQLFKHSSEERTPSEDPLTRRVARRLAVSAARGVQMRRGGTARS
jgi:hypothetical protein